MQMYNMYNIYYLLRGYTIVLAFFKKVSGSFFNVSISGVQKGLWALGYDFSV